MGKDRKPLGALAVVALAALLLSAVVAGDALADKPAHAGTGGNGGGANGSTPALTVTPDPVPLGTASIVITGSGFRANQYLEVGVMGLVPSSFPMTDGNGNFQITYSPYRGFDGAGNYTAVAIQNRGHKLIYLASTPFTVCSTNPCP